MVGLGASASARSSSLCRVHLLRFRLNAHSSRPGCSFPIDGPAETWNHAARGEAYELVHAGSVVCFWRFIGGFRLARTPSARGPPRRGIEVRPGDQASPAEPQKSTTKDLPTGIVGTDATCTAFTAAFEERPEWRSRSSATVKGRAAPTCRQRRPGRKSPRRSGPAPGSRSSAASRRCWPGRCRAARERGRTPTPGSGHARSKAPQPVFRRRAADRHLRRPPILQISKETGAPLFGAPLLAFTRTSPACATTLAWEGHQGPGELYLDPLAFHRTCPSRDSRRRSSLRRDEDRCVGVSRRSRALPTSARARGRTGASECTTGLVVGGEAANAPRVGDKGRPSPAVPMATMASSR